MYYKNRRVVFTKHAIERLRESQLDIIGGLKLFDDCVEENEVNHYKDMARSKSNKYGDQEKMTYFRSGSHIITAKETTDKFKGDDIWLVITVTNQLATSKALSKSFWSGLDK